MRAIVAEDDIAIRKMVVGMIEEVCEGINVQEVGNGKDLASEVQKGDYAFVVTDNSMEGGNGVDAVREIRKYNTRIPICMASSDSIFTGKPIEQQAREAGATDFLYKPFTFEELKAVVKKYIAARGM